MEYPNMHLSLLLSFFGAVVSLQLDHFTFPQTDDYEIDCTLPDGEQGMCRNIRYCPTAFDSREKVKTCYFEKFEHFVCCRDKVKLYASDIACESYYPPKFEIIKGIRTSAKEFPYMVALGWPQTSAAVHDYKCGGALISPEFVLTAAHCASVGGLPPVVVLPGGTKLSDDKAKLYTIAQVIVHPEYQSSKAYHDIALLKLQEPVLNFKPACLRPEITSGQNVTAIGYGHTVFAGKPSDELLKAYLTIVSNTVCQQHYTNSDSVPNGIQDTQLCAKDNEFGRDTCQGDSGGPIMQFDSYKPFIVGVTSFGQGCATESPGVYTRISKYMDWIEGIVWPKSGGP